MENRSSLWAGIGSGAAGAALVYFLDPNRGGRRRGRIRDAVAHGANVAADAVETTARDTANRMYGTAAVLGRSVRRDAVDDRVLSERVRATLGRVVTHPHAIEVAVRHGCVTLCGPILEAETKPLVSAVSKVQGVREVISLLEEHEVAAGVPSLQGGNVRPLRPDVLQERWSPATLVLGGVTGALLVGYGISRRDVPGALIASGGACLVACAGTNARMRRLNKRLQQREDSQGIGQDDRLIDAERFPRKGDDE